MKRLFFFIILAISMQSIFCAESEMQKSKNLLTASQLFDIWWNEDNGPISEDFNTTSHQKQEAREDFFDSDLSNCSRRDVRRLMTIVGLGCVVGAYAMPQLAAPIITYGAITTTALGFNLVAYKAAKDSKKTE